MVSTLISLSFSPLSNHFYPNAQFYCIWFLKSLDFPGEAVDRTLPANARDMGLIPGPRRFHMPQGN